MSPFVCAEKNEGKNWLPVNRTIDHTCLDQLQRQFTCCSVFGRTHGENKGVGICRNVIRGHVCSGDLLSQPVNVGKHHNLRFVPHSSR